MKIKSVTEDGELVTLLLEGQNSFVRIVFKVKQPSIMEYPKLPHILLSILLNSTEVVEMVEL